MRGRLAGGLLGLLLLAACGDAGPPPTAAPLAAAGRPWATQLPTPTAGAADPPPTAPPLAAGPATLVPAPASEAPDWTFAVVGDTWKDTPMLRYILRDAATAHDALLIDLGDLTPQGRPEQMTAFAALAQTAGLPVYAVPGNHDVAWSHTTAPFERYWPRHQSFDYRNAHFTLVDDSAVTLTAAELAWVAADLGATRQPLKFVFMHVPALLPYPIPSEEALAAGAPAFLALLAQHQVTAVYAGHLHAYTRVAQDGIPYVITGGGGEPLHVPALLGGRFHYLRVTVHGRSAQDTPIWLDGVPTPGP